MMPRADFADECVHELTRAFCSWCKNKDKPGKKDPGVWYVSNPSAEANIAWPHCAALFDSKCPSCEWPIKTGEIIGKRNNEWICSDCAADYDLRHTGGA